VTPAQDDLDYRRERNGQDRADDAQDRAGDQHHIAIAAGRLP
jgi:hypothetical protein